MARFAFILGIWVLAASLGVLGYQVLTLYFYNDWPAVSLAFGWQTFADLWHSIFGEFWKLPAGGMPPVLAWLPGVPLGLVGILVSYALFLLSDSLRGRSARS